MAQKANMIWFLHFLHHPVIFFSSFLSTKFSQNGLLSVLRMYTYATLKLYPFPTQSFSTWNVVLLFPIPHPSLYKAFYLDFSLNVIPQIWVMTFSSSTVRQLLNHFLSSNHLNPFHGSSQYLMRSPFIYLFLCGLSPISYQDVSFRTVPCLSSHYAISIIQSIAWHLVCAQEILGVVEDSDLTL